MYQQQPTKFPATVIVCMFNKRQGGYDKHNFNKIVLPYLERHSAKLITEVRGLSMFEIDLPDLETSLKLQETLKRQCKWLDCTYGMRIE